MNHTNDPCRDARDEAVAVQRFKKLRGIEDDSELASALESERIAGLAPTVGETDRMEFLDSVD